MTAWVRWFVKCSNCFCLCDDEKDSDRYFSLLDVLSNIDKNKCVELNFPIPISSH